MRLNDLPRAKVQIVQAVQIVQPVPKTFAHFYLICLGNVETYHPFFFASHVRRSIVNSLSSTV
jgi:hypothetical protein